MWLVVELLYTVGHKKRSQLIFVCNFVKNQRILMQFSLRDLEMNGTCDTEHDPPHVINVATLPCESQNTENVILQLYITTKKLHHMYHSFIKVDQGHHVPYIYLFRVLYSKACVKQRFMTSTTCKHAWYKLVLTLTGTSSMLAWPSEIMCAWWWWTLWTHNLTWMFIYMIHQNIFMNLSM